MPWVPVVHAAWSGEDGAGRLRADEADTAAAAARVAAALQRRGYRSEVVALDLDLSRLVAIAAARPHAVFNMVEAIRGSAALLPLVPMTLEHLAVPFTGAGAEAAMVTASKLLARLALRAGGVATPDASADGTGLAGAVIVKPVWEHGSLGIDEGSVVPAARAAGEIAARTARFGTEFFAEAFIDGREFNVSILDGTVLPVPEMTFTGFAPDRPAIVDWSAKWDVASAAARGTVRRFGIEAREPGLAARVAETARRCWHVLRLTGYARVDVRVGVDDIPRVIDVNVNPGLGVGAGFAAAAETAGMGFDDLVAAVVDAARRPVDAAAA